MLGGGIINNTDNIEIRCPGMYIDPKTKVTRPCNKMFIVGSPGFDIFGKPKKQTIKCQRCKNYFTITSIIEERVIVKVLATVMRLKE